MHRAGFMQTPPSLSVFLGTQPGGSGRGLPDLIIFKWDVGNYILTEWAQQHPLPSENIVEMKRVLHSIASYRTQCGYPSEKRDITFRAGWRQSCEELFVFVECLQFDTMYDGHLKEALKANSTPADAAQNQLSEFLEPIAKQATAESKETGGTITTTCYHEPLSLTITTKCYHEPLHCH